MNELETFLTTGVFAFLLTFVRVGTIIMIMPGISNTFVPGQIRLLFALALTLVMSPFVKQYLPSEMPSNLALMLLLFGEFMIGMFIGTIARILIAALDTAGMIISMQSSLANAQLFNPAFAAQGSIVGSFLTLTGILLLFTTDLYHFLIVGIIRSYEIMPMGVLPEMADLSKTIVDAVASSFMVAIQMTAPFLIVILLMYVGMAVMSKMMPAVQVFMIAVPVQIALALLILVGVLSAMMLVWMDQYRQGMELLTFIGAEN
jgi:flagellar biosynthesis protein FliR